jgi:YHS domain-containing protein
MGDPVTKVYGNQEIKFCCKPCIKEFEKEPDRYLKKLAR